MKRIQLLAAAASAAIAVLSAGAASATVITFDDIGVPNSVYPYYTQTGFVDQGYQFSTNSDVIDLSAGAPWAGTGPAYSGNYAALNDYYGIMTMTKLGGGIFNLDSFFIKGWFGNNGANQALAYSNNVLVGTVNYYLTGGWNQVVTNFANVDKVSFNANNVILVDNVQVSGGGAVPEPATWALMIGGFGMAGAMLRRSRAVSAAA